MKRSSILIGALVTSMVWGCATEFASIQSSQLTFLRDRLRGSADRGPRPAWTIRWLGEERPIYAINVGSQVLFANKSGDLLRFQGNQIVEARNLLAGEMTVHIEQSGTSLRYLVNGSDVGTHTCHRWEFEEVEKKSDSTSFIQRCSGGEMTYVNRFAINKERELVQLMYHVHPQYPPAQLELLGQ